MDFQPMELHLEDSLNTPTIITKNFCDLRFECIIIVPVCGHHSSSIKLEIETFYTATISWEIEDNFKENKFTFNRFDASVPDEIHLNVPWCYPITEITTNTSDILSLAPPQPPPSDVPLSL